MEGRGEVGAAHTEVDADRLANLRGERFLLSQTADGAIEYQVFRVLIEQGIQVFAE